MIATLSNKKTNRLPHVLEHASGDKRFKILEAHIKKHQFKQDALIEVLHKAQELFGYLSTDLLIYIAHSLKLPPSRVYGVATFYHFFTLKPAGEHTCVVCMGTACYIKGAPQLLTSLKKELGVSPGQTTPDGQVSVLTARCLGSCGLAPAVVYDKDVAGKVTAQQLRERIAKWKPHVS